MKTNLLILCCCFFSLPLLQAQLFVGVKAGMNLTTFQQENPNELDLNELQIAPSGLTGLVAKYTINRHLFVLGDLIYAGKGSKGTFPIKEHQRYSLHYLEAALAPTVKLHRHINIDIGFYYSRLLGAFAATDNRFLQNVKPQFDQQDYGVQGGVSLDFHGFHVGLRYQHGLKKWLNSSGSTWSNRGLQIWVSYLYPCFKGRY